MFRDSIDPMRLVLPLFPISQKRKPRHREARCTCPRSHSHSLEGPPEAHAGGLRPEATKVKFYFLFLKYSKSQVANFQRCKRATTQTSLDLSFFQEGR